MKADSSIYKGFTITVFKDVDEGYGDFFVRVQRKDGSFVDKDFDMAECELFDSVTEAIREGQNIVDKFLNE